MTQRQINQIIREILYVSESTDDFDRLQITISPFATEQPGDDPAYEISIEWGEPVLVSGSNPPRYNAMEWELFSQETIKP